MIEREYNEIKKVRTEKEVWKYIKKYRKEHVPINKEIKIENWKE